MQNADGKRHVKGLVIERYLLAVVELKLPLWNLRGRSVDHPRGDVDTVKLAEVLADVARHEPDAASNVEHAALLQRSELPIARSDELIGLDSDEEIMALPGKVDRLLDFGHIALLVFLEPHVSSGS